MKDWFDPLDFYETRKFERDLSQGASPAFAVHKFAKTLKNSCF
jgi:hypothetical protein